MRKKYKHIIWDWNGTILNDVELCVDIINNILGRRGLSKLSIQQYRHIFTFPVRNYYEEAGLDLKKYSFELLGREWMDEYEVRKGECGLFSGVKQMIEKINSLSIDQSILSAYIQNTLEEIVNGFGLRRYFKYLVGLDHIYATSKLELGIELMRRLDNGRDEVLLVGDTLHDFEVAEEIGADCILIAGGHQSSERLAECRVPVLQKISDLNLFL